RPDRSPWPLDLGTWQLSRAKGRLSGDGSELVRSVSLCRVRGQEPADGVSLERSSRYAGDQRDCVRQQLWRQESSCGGKLRWTGAVWHLRYGWQRQSVVRELQRHG